MQTVCFKSEKLLKCRFRYGKIKIKLKKGGD